jgi:hypothetical protein
MEGDVVNRENQISKFHGFNVSEGFKGKTLETLKLDFRL